MTNFRQGKSKYTEDGWQLLNLERNKYPLRRCKCTSKKLTCQLWVCLLPAVLPLKCTAGEVVLWRIRCILGGRQRSCSSSNAGESKQIGVSKGAHSAFHWPKRIFGQCAGPWKDLFNSATFCLCSCNLWSALSFRFLIFLCSKKQTK